MAEVERVTEGAILLTETAGLRQIVFRDDPGSGVMLKACYAETAVGAAR